MPFFTNRGIMPLPTSGSYAGPGDVTSGWVIWHGMRAFSAATAATPTNAIQLRYVDGTTVTYQTQADGTINLTATGSSNGVSHATNITNHTGPATISIWYDQTATGNNIQNVTVAEQPTFTLSALGGFPGATFAGAQCLQSVTPISQAQPFALSAVANNTGGVNAWIGSFAGTLGMTSDATIFSIYAGTAVETHAAVSGSYHAANGTLLSGAGNSFLYVDGSDSVTGANVGTNAISQSMSVGASDDVTLGSPLTGVITEIGLFNSFFSGANRAALNTQQHTVYGF